MGVHNFYAGWPAQMWRGQWIKRVKGVKDSRPGAGSDGSDGNSSAGQCSVGSDFRGVESDKRSNRSDR